MTGLVEQPPGSTGPRGSAAIRTSGAGHTRGPSAGQASLAVLKVPWVQRFHWPSVRVPSGDSPGNTMLSGSGRPWANPPPGEVPGERWKQPHGARRRSWSLSVGPSSWRRSPRWCALRYGLMSAPGPRRVVVPSRRARTRASRSEPAVGERELRAGRAVGLVRCGSAEFLSQDTSPSRECDTALSAIPTLRKVSTG